MTRSRLWLAFSTVLSVGVGFLAGRMYTRNHVSTSSAIGRLYEVDGETYVDGALISFLTPRAESSETLPSGDWTLLRYRSAVLFVNLLHERELLPRQRGALYAVRRLRGESSEAKNDRHVQQFLQEMIDLGLVEFVGRWKNWSEPLKRPDAETRA